MVSLIKNTRLLDERPSDVEALGYEEEVAHVKQRIARLIKRRKHAIVAYLGPFGVGKSTVLKEVKKLTPAYKWVTFEMWRYSNRNELWDAFVIKVASELMHGKDEFDIADQVEGSALNRREWILLGIWIFCVWLALTIFAIIFWFGFKDGIGIGGQFWEAYFKYAAPTIFPVLVLVGLGRFFQLSFITNKRPLRRVFELESLLASKIKSLNKPLVVVVEDADRSSDDGTIFLETLNYFLGRLSSDTKAFVVIAPQSALSFERQEESYKGLETALKVYDEKIYFNSAISDESIDKLYRELEPDVNWTSQLVEATKVIIRAHRRHITIRLLKHALREVVQFTEMNQGANPVVCLAIILARYVEVNDNIGRKQLALRAIESGNEHGSEGAKAFFVAIATGIDKESEALQAQRFVVSFADDDNLLNGAVLKEHPNNTKVITMTISNLHRRLII